MLLNIGSLAKVEPEAEKKKADDQEKKDEEKEKPPTRTPSVWSVSGELIDALAVLRIDNVPWVRILVFLLQSLQYLIFIQDITPPRLVEFFAPHTATRVHVMLDPHGKALSHAYVEVPAVDARDVLSAIQNKSPGKGESLHSVTVAMSSQNELVRGVRHFTTNYQGKADHSY